MRKKTICAMMTGFLAVQGIEVHAETQQTTGEMCIRDSANTEVAEGGGLKLKIGINEKKDTEEKPDEKADDKTDDKTESPSEDDVTQPGEAGNGSGETDDSTENTETDVTYTYVWKHNGKTIDGDFKDTYTKENITKEDAGIYTVEVTAKNDKGTSMAVKMCIRDRTNIRRSRLKTLPRS